MKLPNFRIFYQQCNMLVEISILLLTFGHSGGEKRVLEPLPFVKNLKQLKSSSDSILPVSDLTENLQLTQQYSNCQKPVDRCSSGDEDVRCYGTKLPHSVSGPALTNRSREEDWAGLSLVPACWASVQPLLCAVFHPKCSPDTSHAFLVPRLLCRAAVRPCRVVTDTLSHVPDFLDCSNDQIFSDECDQYEVRGERAKFNTSSTCVAPLVITGTRSAFWPDIEECGLRCQSPTLTSSEYDNIHSLIAAGATISLLASLFAVFTFLVDWKGGSKYPARAIFYLNCCLVLANIGWLAQFAGDSVREDIVCRSDGVARHQEPGGAENMACVIIFILVYFFSLSAAVWAVVVSYSWYITFTWAGSQPNKVQTILTQRSPYFHMAALSLPLVLTIIVLASNKVDGSYISGICFVGYNSSLDQGLLVYLPLFCCLAVGGYFTSKSVGLLLEILREVSKGVLPEEAGVKVRRTVTRILVFSVLVSLGVLTATSCHLYSLDRRGGWTAALDSLVRCNIGQHLGQSQVTACSLEQRPSVPVIQLQLLCMFGAGVLCSSWVWTRNSVTSWTLAVRHLLNRGERPVKLHKHELIAQAFAKRAELQANGRLSLSFHSQHEDPLGMEGVLEANPETSGDFSSGWAAALPHLIQRRPGLCGADQLGLGRRMSLESVSNISQSVSIRSGRFSWFGSRKGSMDSNMSIKQTDLDRLQSIYENAIKPSKKRSKREFFKSHKSRMRPWSRSTTRSRRNSVTSRGSDNSSVFSFSGISQVLPAITLDPKRLTSKVKMNKFSLPSPGKSIDFGRERSNLGQPSPGDPTFIELEEKLRQLASISRTSNITDKDGEVKISIDLARPNTCSIETQTELLEDEVSSKTNMISTGTCRKSEREVFSPHQ